MKKLIILSAIALSGLIFNSANAQGRAEAGFRYSHERYNDHRFEYRGRREFVEPAPVYYNYRPEGPYRGEGRFYREHRWYGGRRYGWRR
jgi:hypothetical protein